MRPFDQLPLWHQILWILGRTILIGLAVEGFVIVFVYVLLLLAR